MLHLPYVKEHKEAVIGGLLKKGVENAPVLIEEVLNHYERRKWHQTKIDEHRSVINQNNKAIGEHMKNRQPELSLKLKSDNEYLNGLLKFLEEEIKDIDTKVKELLVNLPNYAHHSVPEGKGATDNLVWMQSGKLPQLPENPLPQWELIKKYNLVDFDLGVKLTGKGFPVYKGKAAKLQRALINFFLDKAEEAGYGEVQVPILVNSDSAFATGQLPDKEGQMYQIEKDNLYLIPTAEVPITNMFRDVLLKEEDLPIKRVGYTPCFRREAGTWGADVRALNRLHQFDKVEIVQICSPEKSYQALGEMVEYVSSLLKALELPYRILKLCGGDMSFTSALTYDFEVYSAAQDRWLEVSSVSNFEHYQSNRLKLRTKQGLVHTLNGSALALPRILAALLENNQTEKEIRIPHHLQPYLKFTSIS